MNSSSLLSGKRRAIVLFLFCNIAINYMDRVNLGVAAPTIARQFHWNAAQLGWVLSAYSFTYVVFLIPWGWSADRFGARRAGAISISLWSAAAVLTGAASSIGSMISARLGLGVGEAASIPVCNKVIRQWFPAKERGFATTLFHCGIFLSIAFASPFVAWLVVHTGWRGSFFITGSLGILWMLCWLAWFEPPEACSWLPEEERRFILANRDGESAPRRDSARPLGAGSALAYLLSRGSMWGLALTLACTNYMNNLFLAWLPSYLIQKHGMNLLQAGVFSGIPYFVGLALEVSFGRFSDRLLAPHQIKQGARRNQVVVLSLMSCIILLISFANGRASTMAILSVALACNTTVIAMIYALTSDLIEDPRLAGTAFGILLVGGNLAGLAAPVVTGYLVRASGSFDAAFAISGVLPIIGAMSGFWLTRHPIGDSPRTPLAAHATGVVAE